MKNKEIICTDFFNWISKILGQIAYNISFFNGHITIYVSKENLYFVILFLKNHTNCLYEVVSDITCVDFPNKSQRFEVVYQLLSIKFNHRITVKVKVSPIEKVPTITSIFFGANWYEREVFDIFGVYFSNHPDLRKILTDYGFEGYPIRKDFPLSGYTEVRYDLEKKRVVCEPLELSQEFRNFKYIQSKKNNYNRYQNMILVKNLNF